MKCKEPPTAAARHKWCLHLRFDVRRQLPSSSLKDGFDVCQNAQRFSFPFGCLCAPQIAWKKCTFMFFAFALSSSGFIFFFFPDRLLLLRFTQTLASDLAVAKDQEEACHCLSHPPSHAPRSSISPPSSLHGLRAQMSGLEFPLPLTPFMERLLSKGRRLTTYGEGGRTVLPPPFSHTVIGVINWTAVPLQYPPPDALSHTQSRSSSRC